MSSFYQLFIANLKIVYRNKSGVFWNIAVPVGAYAILASLPIPGLLGGSLAYKNFALPGVIAYVIMQSGVYTLAYWMVELRSRGVIKRFLVTPIKNSELAFSLIAARMTVLLIQIILITLVGVLFFHAVFAGNILSTLIIALLGGGIFLAIGLVISSVASSYETAAPLTAAVGMSFTVLGNVFIPMNVLPHTLQTLAKLLPITYLADGLRHAYLNPFDFAVLGKDMAILAVWLLAILLLTVSVFRLRED